MPYVCLCTSQVPSLCNGILSGLKLVWRTMQEVEHVHTTWTAWTGCLSDLSELQYDMIFISQRWNSQRETPVSNEEEDMFWCCVFMLHKVRDLKLEMNLHGACCIDWPLTVWKSITEITGLFHPLSTPHPLRLAATVPLTANTSLSVCALRDTYVSQKLIF